jgi:hypothetical protein
VGGLGSQSVTGEVIDPLGICARNVTICDKRCLPPSREKFFGKGEIAMAKQSTAKKKTAHKSRAAKTTTKIGTMKGGVLVQGSIKAGRDVIQGNQYNDYRQQIAQVATPAQFITEAEKLQAEIAKVKELPALSPAKAPLVLAAEQNVQTATTEAKKEKPDPNIIQDNLKTAAETMEGVGKAIDAAGKVGTKVDEVIIKGMDWGRIAVGLGSLANAAIKLFGG